MATKNLSIDIDKLNDHVRYIEAMCSMIACNENLDDDVSNTAGAAGDHARKIKKLLDKAKPAPNVVKLNQPKGDPSVADKLSAAWHAVHGIKCVASQIDRFDTCNECGDVSGLGHTIMKQAESLIVLIDELQSEHGKSCEGEKS